jgi:hypothetical protein
MRAPCSVQAVKEIDRKGDRLIVFTDEAKSTRFCAGTVGPRAT